MTYTIEDSNEVHVSPATFIFPDEVLLCEKVLYTSREK